MKVIDWIFAQAQKEFLGKKVRVRFKLTEGLPEEADFDQTIEVLNILSPKEEGPLFIIVASNGEKIHIWPQTEVDVVA